LISKRSICSIVLTALWGHEDDSEDRYPCRGPPGLNSPDSLSQGEADSKEVLPRGDAVVPPLNLPGSSGGALLKDLLDAAGGEGDCVNEAVQKVRTPGRMWRDASSRKYHGC
jgi:hypothetical protein